MTKGCLKKLNFWALMLVLLGLGLGASAPAQDLRPAGRRLTEQYGEAVITIRIVVSMQAMGRGQNQPVRAETIGTVISPDGLVVVPLYVLDPAQLVGQLTGMPAEASPLLSSQVKDIKLVLGRQKEVPATVVLRDKDLGLALLRPIEKPKEKFKFVDLKNTEEPQPLDPIILMTRLGNAADRQIGLVPGSIQAVVSKPRKFFVPSGGFAGFGIPAFSAGSKLLGIFMLRVSVGAAQDMQSGLFSMNLSHMGLLPIILPAAELQRLAAQAPEKPEKAPTPTPAAAAKTGAKAPAAAKKK